MLTNLVAGYTEAIQSLCSPGQQVGSLVLVHHIAEHHAVSLHLDIRNINFQPQALILRVFFGGYSLWQRKLAASLRTRVVAVGFRFRVDFNPWPFPIGAFPLFHLLSICRWGFLLS